MSLSVNSKQQDYINNRRIEQDIATKKIIYAMLQLQQKRLDIEDRDRARQERKRKLTKGSKLGMKYTAQAMARAST